MKIKKISALIAIIPLMLLMSGVVEVDKARACSCAMSGFPQEELAHASAVFSGLVQSVDESSESMSAYSAEPVKVVFEVKKVWKGDFSGGEEMLVTTASNRYGAVCGYSFVEGESYLVYANGEDTLNVSLCSRTSVLDQASADLEYLNSLIPAEDHPQENDPVIDVGNGIESENDPMVDIGSDAENDPKLPTSSTEETPTKESVSLGIIYWVLGIFLVLMLSIYIFVRQRG